MQAGARERMPGVNRLLPFAGIIQIRFGGYFSPTHRASPSHDTQDP